LYNYYMAKHHTTTTARANFADIVSRAEYAGERTVVHRHRKPVAVVIPFDDLELLERAEDELDLRDALEAMKEPGPRIPWEQIKKELKL